METEGRRTVTQGPGADGLDDAQRQDRQDNSPDVAATPVMGGAADVSEDVKQLPLLNGMAGMPLPQVIPPLHPLHQGQGMGIPAAAADPNATSVSEFELARRLGVRFDSSNAAWVARWTDTTNDRKKSRWFSIAKYGNSSARRLAIQACLHNMKPTEYPSLRDLTDVLSSFAPTPGTASPPFIGGDLGGMAGSPALAGKLGGQFSHPGLLAGGPGNPFLSGIPGMAGYMAGLSQAAGSGLTLPNAGMFCQGVPSAMLGANPRGGDSDHSGPDGNDHGSGSHAGADGNESHDHIKQDYGMSDFEKHQREFAEAMHHHHQQQHHPHHHHPHHVPNGVKLEGAGLSEMDAATAAAVNAAAAAAAGDASFLQSLGPPGSQLISSSRYSDQDSSDGDGQTTDDDEDDDDVDNQKDGDEAYDPNRKRKKRKMVTSDSAGDMTGTLVSLGETGEGQSLMQGLNGGMASYYGLYPGFQQQHQQQLLLQHMSGTQQQGSQQGGMLPLLPQSSFVVPVFHPQLGGPHGSGFLPHVASFQSDMTSGGDPTANAKMTCERGLHYSKCYRGNQECWIAVWNTKGGRIMHEAFDVGDLGFEGAKAKAREARDAAHSNNVAVTENSRPSWKSHSNTGIPHVSLDSQQLRFRAHKFGRRLCRSFSFGRRRGSYATRESAFDAAVLWLIQTPTEEEIATVAGGGSNSKLEDPLQ